MYHQTPRVGKGRTGGAGAAIDGVRLRQALRIALETPLVQSKQAQWRAPGSLELSGSARYGAAGDSRAGKLSADSVGASFCSS